MAGAEITAAESTIPPIQKMIVEVKQQLGPLLDGPSGPVDLSPAGKLGADLDIGGCGGW